MRALKLYTMGILVAGMVGLISTSLAQDKALTEGDRQALLEKLKELKDGAGGRAEQRAGTALAAFREAAASDDRAHQLYVDCVEKVRFADEKKSTQSFREWKRKHKEKNDKPEFRRVLRHQLNWLLLTIEADALAEAEEEGEEVDRSALVPKTLTALEAILGDDSLEAGQFKTLGEDVTKTVFALAYGIDAKGNWPTGPLKFEAIYKEHILPPLEAEKDYATFRSAWNKWILQEALLLEAKAKNPEKGERSASFERFLVEIGRAHV